MWLIKQLLGIFEARFKPDFRTFLGDEAIVSMSDDRAIEFAKELVLKVETSLFVLNGSEIVYL